MNKTDIIAHFIKQTGAKTVLDLGCYNLRQYDAIKRAGHQVAYTGVDVKPNNWDKYADDKNVQVFKKEANEFLAECDKQFDIILFSGMIDWLGDAAEMFSSNSFETIKLIQRVMNPQSKLIVVSVNNDLSKRVLNVLTAGKSPGMRYMFDRRILKEDLRRLGYSVVQDLYLPWEAKIFEMIRKTLFLGKWANHELIFVCKKG